MHEFLADIMAKMAGANKIRLMNTNHVDKALKTRTEHVEHYAELEGVLESPTVEFMHINSAENENSDEAPYIINITGVWGTSLEVEGEWLVLAKAMGDAGLTGDAVSLPGHGESGKPIGGWESQEAFDKAAQMIVEHIKKVKEKFPNKKIVIHAWSMGGITALKAASLAPGLIDGIILVDTPVFPSDFADSALRFALYPTQSMRRDPAKKVIQEPPLALDTKLEGLGIFVKRIRIRNSPKGMPLREVVLASAKNLVHQDLAADGTLKKVANKGTAILLIHGDNDFVIRSSQVKRLANYVNAAGGNIETVTIKNAGHSLLLEHPREVAKVDERWLIAQGFLTSNQSKNTKPDPLATTYDRTNGTWT